MSGESVAICMATYNPDPALLYRQIDSIRRQTLDGWHCFVRDDGSSKDGLEAVHEAFRGDPRITLFPGTDRLGVARNFAFLLGQEAVRRADYVALADQDDFWWATKLELMVDALRQSPNLVAHCDLRVVDRSGQVLVQSFRRSGPRAATSIAQAVFRNRIPGCSLLLRSDVLARALPFPDLGTGAYHDHWLAVVGLATGGLTYVDRPLVDYVQHSGNAVGPLAGLQVGRPVIPDGGAKEKIVAEINRAMDRELPALSAMAICLQTRVEFLSARDRLQLDRIGGLVEGRTASWLWLARRALRQAMDQRSRYDTEVRLLCAFIFVRLFRRHR
jgi:Glycosyl transferase family 2